MSTRAMDLNSSAERCEAAPTPEEPKVSLAGLALAKAMSSPMFAAATRGWAVTMYAAAETSDTGANRSTFFSVSEAVELMRDRKSTRLNSSHTVISYAVFCLKKKKKKRRNYNR